MPLPKPRFDETRNEFISRCILNSEVQNEFPNETQRIAVCYALFEDKSLKESNTDFFKRYAAEYEKNIITAEEKEIKAFTIFLYREYSKGIDAYLQSGKVAGWEFYFNVNQIAALYSIMYTNIGMRFSKLYASFFGSRYSPVIKPNDYFILWRDYFRDAGKRIGEFKGAGVSITQQKELTRVIQRFHRSAEFQALNEREAQKILRSQVKGLSEWRAKTIVRTEANAAANLANEKTAYDMYGKENLVKWWLTSQDERTRDAHTIAGSIYTQSKPIPASELFNVGGEYLMRPSEGSIAENNINCRCTAIYEPKKN